MILYHYSESKHLVLKPQLGKSRHEYEDPTVVGKPAVFLSSGENDQSYEGTTLVSTFRHKVELSGNNPRLCRDRIEQKESASIQKVIPNSNAPSRWYFYFGILFVVEIAEWNSKANRYEKINHPIIA